MAPRGRPRQRQGLTRMDAAVDAMRKYGFSEKSVREEMNNLLKIYGEDGWAFIEEDSYRVLLDKLLEKSVEEEQQCKDAHLESGGGDENNVMALEAGSSSQIIACSNVEALQNAPVSPIDETLDCVFQNNMSPSNNAMALDAGPSEFLSGSNVEAWLTVPSPSTDEPLDSVFENDMSLVSTLMTRISDDGRSLPTNDAEVNMSEDMDVDLGDMQAIDVIRGGTNVDDGGVGKDGHILSSRIHSRRSVASFRPGRRRRPCYGWISSDEDEDEVNIVRLEPEPLPEDVESLFIEANAKYGRKRRWDVRPENV
ncbi:uncharacterized protein LOC120013576 isoform X2 [Tripterygium wilfordii]|uniref:uncharacterized protein LOC120013576 isoform X2 n=1 Tax=Tripterygium wilfordii TaxID=458696 RepID=UPI0018F83D83|nr:uncharacterized protein LOC120013576 isoform X2 [Tripterygium wilfordii]